jgi:hypothetical protein
MGFTELIWQGEGMTVLLLRTVALVTAFRFTIHVTLCGWLPLHAYLDRCMNKLPLLRCFVTSRISFMLDNANCFYASNVTQLSHLGTNRHSNADRSSVPPYTTSLVPQCTRKAFPTRFLHLRVLTVLHPAPSTLIAMHNNIPEHSNLHPRSMFLRQSNAPSFTTIQNRKPIILDVYKVFRISDRDGKMFLIPS